MTTMSHPHLFASARQCAAVIALLCTGLWHTAAAAAEPAAPSTDAQPEGEVVAPRFATGEETHTWLQRQASRKQASRTRQTLSGPTMTGVHKRYVESFDKPISETVLRPEAPISGR